MVSAGGVGLAKMQLNAKAAAEAGIVAADSDDTDPDPGCPPVMAKPGPLLSLTGAITFVVAILCWGAMMSTSGISPKTEQSRRRCESLESSFCARILQATGECPITEGCITPHHGYQETDVLGHDMGLSVEQAESGCFCIGHAHNIEEGGGGSSLIDVFFFISSLALTAVAVLSMGRSSKIGDANPGESAVTLAAPPAASSPVSGVNGIAPPSHPPPVLPSGELCRYLPLRLP